MGRYKQIEHTADIALELEGINMEDLIRTAAKAWREVVLDETPGNALEKKQISFETSSPEELLVDTIGELNYLLITGHWVFSRFEHIRLDHAEGKWDLSAEISGEPLDPEKHAIEIEIKAVTFHQLDIKNRNGRYQTLLVFDI
jgi:SHS2 domain-containing protein